MQETRAEQIIQYCSLIDGETDLTALMANTSAFINGVLSHINWVGFYVLKGTVLVLGPFQGKPVCYRIPIGKGVCGYCAETRKSIIVPNVHEFTGHIVCDSASNSELVVPIIKATSVYGVIDSDSFRYNNFSEEDWRFIETIAEIFAEKI